MRSVLARSLVTTGLVFGLASATPAAPGFSVRATPAPVSVKAGEIELIEFFSWGCPACYRAEGPLKAYLANAPKGVVLKRVPATFDPLFAKLAPAYYVAETLGVVDKISDPIFAALHDPTQRERGLSATLLAYRRAEIQRADVEPAKQAYVAAMAELFRVHAGVDAERFHATWYSPAIRVKLAEGERQFRDWRVASIPSFGVQGRYLSTHDDALGTHDVDDVLEAMRAAVTEVVRPSR